VGTLKMIYEPIQNMGNTNNNMWSLKTKDYVKILTFAHVINS
jgi:hypothetical protein